MSKLIISTIILLCTATLAVAAKPGTRYNWSGAYAGVNLGSIWTGSQLTANHEILISDTGTYNQNLNSTDVNPGLQFGYLHQLASNWVVGGEADFTYPDTNSNYAAQFTDPDTGATAFDQFNVRNNLQGSLRLRAGYAFDRFLPFITAGVSFASMALNYNNEQGDHYSTSTTQTGWVLGGGLEYGVMENLSVRAEYLYTGYGNALNMAMPEIAGIPDANGAAHANMSTNVARVAANFRF